MLNCDCDDSCRCQVHDLPTHGVIGITNLAAVFLRLKSPSRMKLEGGANCQGLRSQSKIENPWHLKS